MSEPIRAVGNGREADVKVEGLEDCRDQASDQRKNRHEPVKLWIAHEDSRAGERAADDWHDDEHDAQLTRLFLPTEQRRGCVRPIFAAQHKGGFDAGPSPFATA